MTVTQEIFDGSTVNLESVDIGPKSQKCPWYTSVFHYCQFVKIVK